MHEKSRPQFEERIGDLQHEYMRVAMVVDDEDAFDSPAHTKIFIIVLKPLQTRRDRRILFWLGLLGAESKVGQRIEVDSRRHRERQ